MLQGLQATGEADAGAAVTRDCQTFARQTVHIASTSDIDPTTGVRAEREGEIGTGEVRSEAEVRAVGRDGGRRSSTGRQRSDRAGRVRQLHLGDLCVVAARRAVGYASRLIENKLVICISGRAAAQRHIAPPNIAASRTAKSSRAFTDQTPAPVIPQQWLVGSIKGKASRVPVGAIRLGTLEIDLGHRRRSGQPEHQPAVAADHAIGVGAKGITAEVFGGAAIEGIDGSLDVGIDSQRRIVLTAAHHIGHVGPRAIGTGDTDAEPVGTAHLSQHRFKPIILIGL